MASFLPYNLNGGIKMNNFNKLNNKLKAVLYRKNHKEWKKQSLNENGYFVIFNGFVESHILTKISGNALKLYIYLGMHSQNLTGEVWHSNKTIAKYFNKSERTIRGWVLELEELNLIKRMRLVYDGEVHMFLQPYTPGEKRENQKKS